MQLQTIRPTIQSLVKYADSHRVSVDEAVADLESQLKDYKELKGLLTPGLKICYVYVCKLEELSSAARIKEAYIDCKDESPKSVIITFPDMTGKEDLVDKLTAIYRRRYPMAKVS